MLPLGDLHLARAEGNRVLTLNEYERGVMTASLRRFALECGTKADESGKVYSQDYQLDAKFWKRRQDCAIDLYTRIVTSN